MTPAPPPPAADAHPSDARQSDAIRLSRLICILGVVYAHAWTGLDGGSLIQAASTGQGLLRIAVVEVFGRSAVPLLGLIAGWLAAGSAARRPYGAFLAGKARTLLVPMVLWNAIAIVIVCGAVALGLILGPTPSSVWWVLDELFCLATPNDINVQTPFLRDLFVCMAAVPLLARAPRWILFAAIVGALAWAVSGIASPVLLRPPILLYVLVGVAIRRMDLAAAVGATRLAVLAPPFVLLAALAIWLEAGGGAGRLLAPAMAGGLDVLLRLTAAALFWALAWRLAGSVRARPLLRLEPYAFLLFCDHLILMWLGGPLIGAVTGPLGSPLYPIFLLLQPVLALAATVALGQALARVAPRAGRLLSGGRLGGDRA